MEYSEKYIGGFYSLQMSTIHRRRTVLGFGIYVTNKRLLVLPSGQRPSFDKTLGLMPQNLSQEENNRIIKELEARKGFDTAKDRITRLELRIPPGLFRTGHLEITLTTGETWKARVGRTKPGEQLRDLLQAFKPEALNLA